MSDTVKIVRGDETGEVLRRYLPDFVADGWKEMASVDHADIILSMADKETVEKYAKENFGVDLDKRLSLDSMKEKALSLIKE